MNRFLFAVYIKTKSQHSCLDCIAVCSLGSQVREALGTAAGGKKNQGGRRWLPSKLLHLIRYD